MMPLNLADANQPQIIKKLGGNPELKNTWRILALMLEAK